MQRFHAILRNAALVALSFSGSSALVFFGPAAAQSSSEPIIHLDQAWSQTDRETFYQIPQGSEIISYDIFLNLECAGSQDLFRSDAITERYGLFPQVPNPSTNPDGLPIGLTKTVTTEGRWKGEAVGMTCAACHTAQLTYKEKRIRIDGSVGNTFDFMAYVYAADDALQATLTDGAKFDRLALRIGASSSDAKNELRKRLESDAERVHHYRTRSLVTPVAWGPGRLDALAMIGNRVMASETGIPENWSTPLAPVKPPFLWNTTQGSFTQWAGSVQDPIVRNLGETMGVFMPMDLRSETPAEGLFDSNADPLNLWKVENMLWRLAPPKWPEDTLGKIDRERARKGKALFINYCASCHNAWPYTWTEPNKYGRRFLRVGLVPQKYVGTESQQIYQRPYVITGQLSGYLPPPYQGKESVPFGVFQSVLIGGTAARALKKLKLTEAETADLHGYRVYPLSAPPDSVYKAAPLDGTWATAPFLHNGSVPNLYEMLLPVNERTKKFYIGREFDPVKVGFDTNETPGAFLFDTSLPGNSNAGHSFQDGSRGDGIVGPLLPDNERWAIVEYLKSIPEEAGRITPFGGPPNSAP